MRLRSLLLALLLSQHHRRAFGFLHVQPTTPAPRHHHNTRMTMNPTLTDDEAGTAAILETTCSYALQVLNGMADRPPAVGPPSASAPAAIPLPLPEAGQGFTAALNDFQGRWAARLSGSAGPRYLGFVVGGSTPAALAGDWLVGAFDQNPQTTMDTQATWLEREALGWLRALLGLSGAHRGSFVSGATQSNMVGLAVAREWCGRARGVSVSEDGLAALGPVRVLSGCPHSSVYKALSILGLGKGSMELVPLIDGGEGPERREAVDVAALEAALKDNPRGLPTIVVANAGTVNTGDFDAMAAIVALREEKGLTFWLHVDAAFGAFAALDPERAPWLGGWDKADSITIDLHKYLNVPYDSAVQFVRAEHQPLQAATFSNAAAYLQASAGANPAREPDFVSLTPENSRRFRALPAWFALRAYGRAGHADIVQRTLAYARLFGELVASEGEGTLVLLAPVRLNVVCFTLAVQPNSQAAVQAWLDRIRDAGETFLTPTKFRGQWAARAAFSNWKTTEEDCRRAFRSVLAAAKLD